MYFLYLAKVRAVYPANILIPFSWQYSLLYGLALYLRIHGSLYVPHSADVSVAVTHNNEFLRAQYPAESRKGEGVPKGSMSIMSNLPRLFLKNRLASFCEIVMSSRLFKLTLIFSNSLAVSLISLIATWSIPSISFL